MCRPRVNRLTYGSTWCIVLAASQLTIPLLLMHAEGDERVPIAHSRELAQVLTVPGSRLIAVPGGHHRSIQHDEELQAVSLRFIAKALGLTTRGSR